MNKNIDTQIVDEILAQTGYPISTFRARFNSGAYDAVQIFLNVYAKFQVHMTRDYCKVMLGLASKRIDEVKNQKRA
jgi:hypothetical protein